MSGYEDRHMIFANTTPQQRLGFAAWLVENVCDGELSDGARSDLTRAHAILRTQQGLFSKKASVADKVPWLDAEPAQGRIKRGECPWCGTKLPRGDPSCCCWTIMGGVCPEKQLAKEPDDRAPGLPALCADCPLRDS